MPFRWHVDLPGPVAYSRPIRRKGKKPGTLTSVLVWFIVKPLELMIRGLTTLFTVRSRTNTEQLPALPLAGIKQPVSGPTGTGNPGMT